MKIDAKILNKVLPNQIQLYDNKIINHGFIPAMQVCFNILKSINIIQHIQGVKNKNHMVISTDEQKTFDKIEHLFLITTLGKRGIEGPFLNIRKARYG